MHRKSVIYATLAALLAVLLLATGDAAGTSQATLPKPEDIACQGWERTTVIVSWNDNAIDETGYKIERSDNGGPWAEIATVNPDGNGNYGGYHDTGLDVSNQGHRYRVRSFEGTDFSPYSDVCNNRRIYDPQGFRIFYGLRGGSDDCPLISGQNVCLADVSGSDSGNSYVDLQYDALQGSADAYARLGFARRADDPNGGLDKIPVNVVWCDGGGCAGGSSLGLSPFLMEMPFNLTTRAGDPIAYLVALHETFHFLQFKYYGLNDPNDRWIIEGQARSIQDKICIGGDRPTALCFDDIATGYAGYVPEVNGYLGNPNRPIGDTSYQAALFWTYLTEKYGTQYATDQTEIGLDFIRRFWEESADNPGQSGIGVINSVLASLGRSERFRDIWKDFAVASYAKNYNGQDKYRYADMAETGGNYNNVALTVNQALSLGSSYLDTDETVMNWGAKYYQFTPASDVPFIDIKVTQDSTHPVYYTVLGVRGSDIVYEYNSESRHLVLPLLNDNYDQVAVIVAGLENQGNYRIAINGTQPSLRILSPTTGTKARVGNTTAPDKFLVQVEVVDGSGVPMAGINLGSFTFRVGTVDVPAANVLTSAAIMGQQWFILRAPGQANPDPDGSPNTYDLTVGYTGVLTDTEGDAVDYTPRNNADNMLVIDRSGSMGSNNKMASAANAAKLFVDSWRTGDKIGAVTFNSSVVTNMQLTNWTDAPGGGSRKTIFDIINGLTATGGTRIGDSIIAAYNELVARGDPTHDWAMVLLSDGEETDPGTRTFDQAVQDIVDASGKKPVIHTLAVGPDADRPRMQAAASRTGGTYQYVSAPAAIVTANSVQDIADMGLSMDYRYRTIATEVLGRQQFYVHVGPKSGDVRQERLPIIVEPGAAELVLSLSWSGLMGSTQLLDPSDNAIAVFEYDTRHIVWRITNPTGGTWTLVVNEFILGQADQPNAPQAPSAIPPYLVQASLETDVTMNANLTTPIEERVPGHPIDIVASLTDNAPIVDATVVAAVERPLGGFVYVPLRDDGNHNDGAADDGLYGGRFYQTGQQGSYNVTVSANGYSPSIDASFSRQQILSFHMARVDGNGDEIPDIDSDGDGLPDSWEDYWGTDPTVDDAGQDPDNDGSTNYEEWQDGTDPFDPDTDDDGESDSSDADPFEPAETPAIAIPEAYAYPGDGEAFVRFTFEPNYTFVGIFRDESDDLDALYSYQTQLLTPTLTGGVFTDTMLTNGVEYCYMVAAIDNDGDRSAFSAPTCATPKTDPFGPHGSVMINDGDEVTPSPNVALKLWATDAVDPEVDSPAPDFLPPADSASGVTEMLISNDPAFAGASWEAYATGKPWTLAQASGLATVYVKYRDAAGNESDTYVATIWVGNRPGASATVYLPIVIK
ncbi:MAG: VWA domain-containing protein [Chloroflexota bacterium]